MTTLKAAEVGTGTGTRPVRRRRARRFSLWHLFLLPTALIFALPLLQMFLASLSPQAELLKFPPPFIPSRLTVDGFQRLFAQSDILLWLGNTVLVSAVVIASNMVLCSLAGYGFARLKFRGRNFGFLGIVATIMIPTQVLMIPTYVLFSRVGLIDTLGAAIVPWLASAFGIFLMRQFFLSLPVELEEAALIDGCGRWRTFRSIVLPLAKPALTTLAIITLLWSWNDLLWPLVAISDDSRFTLQIGLANFQGMRRTEWSQLMAGNVLATMPLIIAFLVAQKKFIATMTFTGIKG